MTISAICSIEGCASVVLARGWCHAHYARWRRSGDPVPVDRPKECAEPGCGRHVVGQGWCGTHYARYVAVPKRKAAALVAKADRTCAHCSEPIPVGKNARAAYCSRECKVSAYIASGSQREALRRAYYKRTYGLTMDEVETMRLGGCAICGEATGGGRHGQLHIDHCHASGRVRGALCDSCNTGLGKFKDSPELLMAAARYLSQ